MVGVRGAAILVVPHARVALDLEEFLAGVLPSLLARSLEVEGVSVPSVGARVVLRMVEVRGTVVSLLYQVAEAADLAEVDRRISPEVGVDRWVVLGL